MSRARIECVNICQMAVVVKDLKKTIENYWRILGIGPWKIYTFAPPELKEMTIRGKSVDYSMKIAVTTVGNMIIEIIEPMEGPSIYKEFLEENGEGPHHIAYYKVEDVQKSLDIFNEMRIDVLQSGKFYDEEFYYLDTEKIFGVILEVVKTGKIRPPDAIYPEHPKVQ